MAKLDKENDVIRVNLVKLCVMLGLYKNEFCIKTGYSLYNMTNIFTGENVPSSTLLFRLKKRYPTLNLDWLLLDIGEPFKGKIPDLITQYKEDVKLNIYAQRREKWIKEATAICGPAFMKKYAFKFSVPKHKNAVAQRVKRVKVN